MSKDTNLEKDIEDCHNAALSDFATTYIDPSTGFTVFTELLHLQRGKCCGNKCRHCPYGWMNVKSDKQSKELQNGKTTQPWQQRQEEVSVLLGTNSAEESRLAIENRIQQIKALSSLQTGQEASRNGLLAGSSATADSPSSPNKTIPAAASVSCRSLSTTSSSSSPTNDKKTATKSSATTPATTAAASTTTGGRNGGRKTRKNVPYTRSGDAGTSQLLTGERRVKSDLVFDAMGTVDELCSITGIVHSMLLLILLPLQQQNEQQDEAHLESSSSMDNKEDQDNEDEDQVDLNEWLLEIMSRLFDIGSHIANPQRRKRRVRRTDENSDHTADDDDIHVNGVGGGFDPAHIQQLEDWIDIMTEQLPVLHSFILPTSGATLATSHLHQARCVCRRAERTVVQLMIHQSQKSTASCRSITTTKDNYDNEDDDDDDDADDEASFYYVYDDRAVQYLNRLSDFYFTAARWIHYNRAAALGQDGEQEEILYRRPFRGAKQRNRTTQKDSSKKY
jgi:cob(I)alamin adenosyltransferase